LFSSLVLFLLHNYLSYRRKSILRHSDKTTYSNSGNKMGSDSENSSLHEYEELNEDEADFQQTLLERIGEIRATGSFATGNVLDSFRSQASVWMAASPSPYRFRKKRLETSPAKVARLPLASTEKRAENASGRDGEKDAAN
jgi:hypothetical protein